MSEMNDFEKSLNSILVDTFNSILKFEEMSLKNIASVNVTVTEAHILEAISKRGENVSISDIAEALNIAMPTATVAVKKLEHKGFVTKTPCSEDGRRYIVSLTPLGKKVDKAHALFHKKMVRNISREFDKTEQEILLTAVNKLSQFFKEKVED